MGFRIFHFVSFLYVFFFSFLFLLFRFFSLYFIFVFLRFRVFCVSFRYFSPCFLFVFFLSVSFRFFSFFSRFSVYRYLHIVHIYPAFSSISKQTPLVNDTNIASHYFVFLCESKTILNYVIYCYKILLQDSHSSIWQLKCRSDLNSVFPISIFIETHNHHVTAAALHCTSNDLAYATADSDG